MAGEWWNVEVWSLDEQQYVVRRARSIGPGEFRIILGGHQMWKPDIKLMPGEAHLQTAQGDNCVYRAVG